MKDDYIATAQINSRRLKLAHAKNESIMLNKAVGTMKKRRAATKGYYNATLTEGSGLSVAANSGKLTKTPSYRTQVAGKTTKQVKPKNSGPYSKK